MPLIYPWGEYFLYLYEQYSTQQAITAHLFLVCIQTHSSIALERFANKNMVWKNEV